MVITVEYSATANKGDEVLVIRPGTDPALALGLAHVIVKEKLYDPDFVREFTEPATARSLGYPRAPVGARRVSELSRVGARQLDQGPPRRRKTATHTGENGIQVPAALRGEFADFVVWDMKRSGPAAVSCDHVGEHFRTTGIEPALEGTLTVQLVNGATVEVRPVFDLMRSYLLETMTLKTVENITWAPAAAVEILARQIAANRGKTLFAMGMGPNQFVNNDLKDRAVFLVAALAGNIGQHGGNVGWYAGNYRTTMLSGVPRYAAEDPFDPQLDPAGPPHVKAFTRYKSLHYYAAGERILREGNKQFTTGAHVPTPTKAIWLSNSNWQIANTKYHYDVVFNTLPRQECVVVNEWWWSGSCEYADIVYGVEHESFSSSVPAHALEAHLCHHQ
ncbi:MAG: molybdopterin-dependent oxidoreductase [Candidatus Binatia bacterium]|nr:molybdopterin-dependent oxidoreductase [Candidatus Binatia bacterium]